MSLNQFEKLHPLGWSDFFENQLSHLNLPDGVPARVIGEEREKFRLQVGENIFWGEITGRFRHQVETRLDLPSTGDWVWCEPLSGSDRAVIHHLFERRSCLVRKAAGTGNEEQILASNVDVVFITSSVNQDLNPRRLERYLTLAWEGGATPVIILTKADLVESDEARAQILSKVREVAIGVDIHLVSTVTGDGLDALGAYFTGHRTGVLLGSSGVGKSTLANVLLNEEKLKTQAVRDGDDRGRHTTTSRYLFQLPDGGMLIDTPGMRELGLNDHEEGLKTLFDDVEALAQACRFSDCGHASEPGCAVKGALQSGELDAERWQSFLKLQREMFFERTKTDKALASEQKKKWKSIHKSLKALKK